MPALSTIGHLRVSATVANIGRHLPFSLVNLFLIFSLTAQARYYFDSNSFNPHLSCPSTLAGLNAMFPNQPRKADDNCNDAILYAIAPIESLNWRNTLFTCERMGRQAEPAIPAVILNAAPISNHQHRPS